MHESKDAINGINPITLSTKNTASNAKTIITLTCDDHFPQTSAVKTDDIAGIAIYKGYKMEYCEIAKLQSNAIVAGTKNANDNHIDTELR